MEFGFTEEQLQIKKAVREFALREIAPHVAEYDREERFPVEIVRKAAAQGYMGGVVPVEYGGAGLDHVTYTLIIEEISRVCQIVGCALSFPSGLAGSAILRYGTEEQKQRYLAPLARGDAFASVALTEPGSGTDVAALRTTCRRDGKFYVLNGTKAWISFLDVCSWVLTFATLDRSLGHKGICAFIVERGTPGMTFRPYKNKLGFRPLSTGEVIFEDCRVPVENRIGEEGEGFRVAMCAVENGRLGVAARAVGMAQACLDEVIAYARERVVFGHPIGKFQLVQSKITDMVVGIESARYLTYRLAWLKDQRAPDVRREASIAKMVATDVALMAATHAVQIFGAYGCSSEYPVSRYYRDAKVFQIVEGVNELHRALIAEYTLGYR
jgi:alkylation response protein AidB-like acyl-CoA dehydrogenase